MEDLNLYLKDVLTERPHTRVPSADTVLRGIDVVRACDGCLQVTRPDTLKRVRVVS